MHTHFSAVRFSPALRLGNGSKQFQQQQVTLSNGITVTVRPSTRSSLQSSRVQCLDFVFKESDLKEQGCDLGQAPGVFADDEIIPQLKTAGELPADMTFHFHKLDSDANQNRVLTYTAAG